MKIDMNSLLHRLLLKFPPEKSHDLALNALKLAYRFGLLNALLPPLIQKPVTVMGLVFKNPVGLAAGLDKNGQYIDPLAMLGFGFIEIGTVTPKPQSGNPKPRLFRIPESEAIINRMGFNNFGVDYLIKQIRKSSYQGILGINIGKNFLTPVDRALDDYIFCFQQVYPHASYVTINISSPNTPGLRQLQHGSALNDLLVSLKKYQALLAKQHQKYVPLVVKIAPDLTSFEVAQMAEILLKQKIDGVIATNTTLNHDELSLKASHRHEAGGVSGKPLFKTSLAVVAQLYQKLQGKIPIIACGGIMSVNEAQAMMDAGANLVQLYSGLVYRGLGLVQEIVKKL